MTHPTGNPTATTATPPSALTSSSAAPRRRPGALNSAFAAPDATTHRTLYGDPGRLRRRTHALRTAKVTGSDAAHTIANLAASVTPAGSRIADIGCGRGTSSVRLAGRLRPAALTLIDRSAALLDTAIARIREADPSTPVSAICADFHALPLPQGSLNLAVAAFCLYHSARPGTVVSQLARVLTTGTGAHPGHAVLATKSTTSYVELDELMVATDLDQGALTRPSLYATFHSTNIVAITASALDVVDVLHEQHTFRFTSHEQIATYLATTPKYPLPDHLATDATALAAELARRGARTELTMTSTVSYVLARARS
jgi:ubiquinone/menaquinone biosynthesis C-methylase UbiE